MNDFDESMLDPTILAESHPHAQPGTRVDNQPLTGSSNDVNGQ
jgi:hypothetical protein